MSERVLLKSMYLNGLQCPKLLWNAHNGKELFPPTDERTQALFDRGARRRRGPMRKPPSCAI